MPIVAAIAAAPLASATIGAAAIGAGASLSAANKAKKASQYATDQSIAQQDRATQIAQANTQVARDRGDQAINAFADRLGLGQTAPTVGQPNWEAYAAADAGLAQNYAANKDNPQALAAWGLQPDASFEQFLQAHYDRNGKAEGRPLPTYTAEQVAAAAPQNGLTLSPGAQVQSYTRPDAIAAPAAYTPKTYTPATYERPEFDQTLNVGYGDYEGSAESRAADYDIAQQSGAASSAYAASGAGKSGAALKALSRIGQENKVKYYADFRNYRTNQFNTDRSRFDNNFNFDTQLKSSLAQSYDALNSQNALAAAGFARDDYRYAQGRADNNFNLDRAYGTDMALNQRAYETGRYDTKNANYLALAGLGQGAATNYTNSVQTGASNNANALFSQAANTGNAAIAGASGINSLLGSGVNALAYYYGQQKKAA